MAKNRGQIMADEILKIKMAFLTASEEQRLQVIETYPIMNNYQRVALMQCKKYMSTKEKRAYKAQVESVKSNEPSEPNGPQ